MLKNNCAFLLLFVLASTIYGQGEAALPFMAMQKSPMLYGAGQIGAAVPVTTADGFYLNPAQLGNFSRVNNFSVFFMPQKAEWMPKAVSDVKMNSFSVAAGYNFANNNKKIPLSIGVGYYKSSVELKGFGGDEDKFDCFSIGAGYEYYLNFNLGFSAKSFSSKMMDYSSSVANKMVEASGTAYDFGLMITAPVSKLAFNNCKVKIGEQIELKPNLDVTLGYAVSNIGDEIYYFDPYQKDPLPRTARFGYNIDLSMDAKIYETTLKALGYSFTAEAEDLLVEQKISIGEMTTEYQGLFGDIQIGKNLLGLNGDSEVVMHRGHMFNLLETLTIAFGRYNGNYLEVKTNAIGVSSDGLFKVLNACVDNKFVDYITSHFSVEYTNANIFVDTFAETNYKGIAINYKGLVL